MEHMHGISFAPVVELLKSATLLAVLLFFYGDMRPHLAGMKRWQAELYQSAFFVLFTLVAMQIVAISAGGTLVNLRSEAVLLAALFGGPIAGLAATGAAVMVRAFDTVGNTPLGTAILVAACAIGFAYRQWLQTQQRRIRYLDLVALGVVLDLARIVAWLMLFGYRGMLAHIDSAWDEVLVVFPVTLFALARDRSAGRGAPAAVACDRRQRGPSSQRPRSAAILSNADGSRGSLHLRKSHADTMDRFDRHRTARQAAPVDLEPEQRAADPRRPRASPRRPAARHDGAGRADARRQIAVGDRHDLSGAQCARRDHRERRRRRRRDRALHHARGDRPGATRCCSA